MPPEARPKLHYISVYPFDNRGTSSDERVLHSLLTSLSSERERQVLVNRGYIFSFAYTGLSWKSWAKISRAKIREPDLSRVRSTLVGWKHFAEKHQMEVLDGCGIDIRNVALLPEGLVDSSSVVLCSSELESTG